MRQDLIERVKKGDAWIHYGKRNHGTLEQLRAIHKACVPSDTTICSGQNNFYCVISGLSWYFSDRNHTNQPTIKVSEFFQAEMTFQRAKVVSVRLHEHKYSFVDLYTKFLHQPFTPCAEVDVPQTVIEALQADNSQTIVIGGYIYKI